MTILGFFCLFGRTEVRMYLITKSIASFQAYILSYTIFLSTALIFLVIFPESRTISAAYFPPPAFLFLLLLLLLTVKKIYNSRLIYTHVFYHNILLSFEILLTLYHSVE